jgi:uncharacterized membrane protein YhdT
MLIYVLKFLLENTRSCVLLPPYDFITLDFWLSRIVFMNIRLHKCP